MDKILITGANSFIGKSYIKYKKSLTQVNQFDIKNNDLKTCSLSEYNCILHLAAIVHSGSKLSKELYFKINSDLAFNTAKQAKEQGIKQFVLLSSVKVFGENTKKNQVWNEKSPCFPKDFYGQSKIDAEQRILELQDSNFTVSIIRSAVVYGPEVKANILSLIKLVSKVNILPFASINNQRSFVYIENLVAIIDRIILQKANGIFIATDGITVSTTQLVKEIALHLNKRIFLFKLPIKNIALTIAPFLNKLFSNIAINNKQTLESINLQLPYTFSEGIKKTIDWYQTLKK